MIKITQNQYYGKDNEVPDFLPEGSSMFTDTGKLHFYPKGVKVSLGVDSNEISIASTVDPENISEGVNGLAIYDLMFDKETVTNAIDIPFLATIPGYISKADGSLVNNSGFRSTGPLPVNEGDGIRRISQSYNVSISSTTPIAFYDSNQNFVSSYQSFVEATQDFVIPSGVSFVRVSGSAAAGLDVKNLTYTLGDYIEEIKEGIFPSVIKIDDYRIQLKQIASVGGQPFYGGGSGYHIFQPTSNGVAPRFYIIPKGSPTGIQSKFEMFTSDYTDGSTDYSGMNILAYEDEIHIGSNKGGSGTNHKQIIGGKYTGSSLQTSSARTEYNLDNTVNRIANKHNFDGGDLEVTEDGAGVILTSPNGSKFKLTVDNSGAISTSPA